MFDRVLCTSYRCQTLEDSKDYHYANHQQQKSNTSVHCTLESESQRRKHNAAKCRMEQHFPYVGKRQSKISFMARGFPIPKAGSLAYMHPFCAAVEGSCPLPLEDRYICRVGQEQYDACIRSRDKRLLTESEKDVPTQSDQSTNFMGSLSLGNEMFWVQGHS